MKMMAVEDSAKADERKELGIFWVPVSLMRI